MAKRREKEDDYGDDFRKDVTPEPAENSNEFYTRKQRTTATELAPDTEADYAPTDRNAERENYKNPDAGPMNYKKWERYGK